LVGRCALQRTSPDRLRGPKSSPPLMALPALRVGRDVAAHWFPAPCTAPLGQITTPTGLSSRPQLSAVETAASDIGLQLTFSELPSSSLGSAPEGTSPCASHGLSLPSDDIGPRARSPWAYLTQHLPLSSFLSSSGVYIPRSFATLFHAAAAHRVFTSRVFPTRDSPATISGPVPSWSYETTTGLVSGPPKR
jgi:hypothetical protein